MFPKNKQKNIVVFGGATYAGSFFCYQQLQNNQKVFCVDERKNLESLFVNKLVNDKNISLLSSSSDLYSLEKIDLVIIFNPSRYLENAIKISYQFKPTLYVFYENDFHNQFELFERYNPSKIIYFQDLYGPQLDLKEDYLMNKLFSDVLFSETLKIPVSKKTNFYPLFLEDFLIACKKIFDPLNSGQKIFYIRSKKSYKAVEIAKKINSKLNPKMEIEMVASNFSEAFNQLPVSNLKGWKSKTSLEKGINKTLSSLLLKDKSRDKRQEKKADGLESKFKKILYVTFLSLVILFVGTITLSIVNFKTLEKGIISGDYSTIKNQITLSNYLLNGSRILVLGVSRGVGLVDKDKGQKIEKGYEAAVLMAKGAKEITQALDEGQVIAKAVLGNDDLNIVQKTQIVSSFLLKASDSFGQSQTLLSQTSGLGLIDSQTKKINNLIPEIKRWLNDSSELVQLMPNILGVSENKKYLVLFQNNSEIRPSGGFIGSFAIVNMNKGKLADFKVMDVYSADGQLKGHVEPPEKLKTYLGQDNWYLRDSNWSPDFPTAASQAIWFLEKETGQKVDGVIAANLTVAQKILEATGEIYLPDYNEKVNSSNFFEKAEYHSEAGFFPGSTGKKDYLGHVSSILFDKIKSGDSNLMSKVGKVLFTSLEEKEMQIYLVDQKMMQRMMKIGWGGEVKDPRCSTSKNCLMDYLFTVEANVGVNKSNYFLKKEMRQKVSLDAGQINSKLIIDYKNESPNDVFPAGKYKNYLRVYVPKGAVLDSCLMDKENCGIDWTIDFNKEVFGLLVEVPVGQSKRVEIGWHQLKNFTGGDYYLYWQKQSGTKNDSVSLTINFPKNYHVLSTNSSALTGEGQIVYNTSLSRDIVFGTKLEK